MNLNNFTTEPISKLFFRYLVPSICGTMVTSIYVLADTIITVSYTHLVARTHHLVNNIAVVCHKKKPFRILIKSSNIGDPRWIV